MSEWSLQELPLKSCIRTAPPNRFIGYLCEFSKLPQQTTCVIALGKSIRFCLNNQARASQPSSLRVTNYTITLQQPIVRRMFRLIFLFTSSLPSKLSASLPATATTKTSIQSVSYDCGVRNSSPPTPHSNTPWERWVVHNNKLPPGWERTETEYTPLLGRLDSTPVLVP